MSEQRKVIKLADGKVALAWVEDGDLVISVPGTWCVSAVYPALNRDFTTIRISQILQDSMNRVN